MGGDRLLVGREEKFGGKGIFLGGGMSKFSDGGGGFFGGWGGRNFCGGGGGGGNPSPSPNSPSREDLVVGHSKKLE